MHAFVISGGSPEKRQTEINKKLQEWQVSSFDQIILTTEEGSIGVSEVRAFQQRLQLSPLQGSYTAGIIPNAHLATTEAQNALLKTLEEPPPHAQIILETPSAQTLLPTILSRCQLMNLGEAKGFSDEEIDHVLKDIKQVQTTEKVGERIKIIDTLAPTREDAKLWIEKAILASRQELLRLIHTGCGLDTPPKETIPSIWIVKLLRHLLEAQRQLAANANPKLVLDHVFLSKH